MITTLMAAPLAVLLGVMVYLRLNRERLDERVAAGLERWLEQEAAAMRAWRGPNLLDFTTAEYRRGRELGLGWAVPRRRIKIFRTIRARLSDGYRIKVRACARGLVRPVIVRSVEVEVHRQRRAG